MNGQVQKYGRWPWPREKIARVIDEALSNGARSISFDIIFSEKQDALINSLKSVATSIEKKFPAQAQQLSNLFENEIDNNNHDRVLSEIVEKHADKLIMGAVYTEFSSGSGRPHDYVDYCLAAIEKKNGNYDYWDKEDFLIGVTDTSELIFPEAWEGLIVQHLDKLDEQVAYEWLQGDNNITRYYQANNIPASKQIIVTLTRHLIKNKPAKYNQVLDQISQPAHRKALAWNSVKALLARNERVEVETQMSETNGDYCLYRFLSDKDELLPSVEAQWSAVTKDVAKFSEMSFSEARDLLRFGTLFNPVKRTYEWLLNIPSIAENTVHSASFNATQDNDGSIRRARLFVRTNNQFQPNISLKTYLVVNNYSATVNLIENPYSDGNQVDSKVVRDVEINDEDGNLVTKLPTDSEGRLLINYAGPQKMFSYLSASELLDQDDDMVVEQMVKKNGQWLEEKIKVKKKDYLKNKSFIFGATAIGIYDLRVTPFEEDYPGVETHANLLDNLMRGDFLKKSESEEWAVPLIILLGGILFSFLVSKLGAVSGLALTTVLGSAVYIVDHFLVFSKGYVINIIFLFFSIGFLYTFLTFFKYFTEERKKKQLKGTFQKYVSPAIVNEILKDPSKLELGGIKQEMTVFFSDVRGFTTISERLDPKALSDLLNAYLTPMTEIIFECQGTLDKYMGDAIMAFFGAPIPSKNHAAQACRSALEQIDKLKNLQKEWEEQGLPMIDVGIGINTGDMSVGNMGSKTVRNYTVMGDAVNLGARLEGINKQYGTRIIVSEFTHKQIEKDQTPHSRDRLGASKGKKRAGENL